MIFKMAKKNSTIIRVDLETYRKLKDISVKTGVSISKATKDMLKAAKGKRINFDIEF